MHRLIIIEGRHQTITTENKAPDSGHALAMACQYSVSSLKFTWLESVTNRNLTAAILMEVWAQNAFPAQSGYQIGQKMLARMLIIPGVSASLSAKLAKMLLLMKTPLCTGQRPDHVILHQTVIVGDQEVTGKDW